MGEFLLLLMIAVKRNLTLLVIGWSAATKLVGLRTINNTPTAWPAVSICIVGHGAGQWAWQWAPFPLWSPCSYLTTENPKLLPIINFFSEILEVWFKCITMKERNLGTGKGPRREEIHHHLLCVYYVSGAMLSDFHPFSHFSLTTTP